jgi:hypothetical protein
VAKAARPWDGGRTDVGSWGIGVGAGRQVALVEDEKQDGEYAGDAGREILGGQHAIGDHSRLDLRVDGESVPDVAGWGKDGALDAVPEFAETNDALARRLENVLIDPAEAEEQAAAA